MLKRMKRRIAFILAIFVLVQAVDMKPIYALAAQSDEIAVTFACRQGETLLEEAVIQLTDASGKEYQVKGTECLALQQGEYHFCASYDKSVTEGDFTVGTAKAASEQESTDKQTIEIPLAEENWLQSVQFYQNKNREGEFERQKTDAGYQFFVPDAIEGSVYVYAQKDVAVTPSDAAFYTVYQKVDGTAVESKKSWSSNSTVCAGVLAKGSQGNAIACEVRYEDAETGYTMKQIYQAEFVRTPTLSGLKVGDGSSSCTADTAFNSLKNTYTYNIGASVEEVYIYPQMAGSAQEGYSVTVNGEESGDIDKEGIKVPLSSDGSTTVTVEVSLQNNKRSFTNTYTLTILKQPEAMVSVQLAEGCSIEIKDSSGNVQQADTDGVYHLISGNQYSYIGTKETYYHQSGEFTAENSLKLEINIPIESVISSLDFGTGMAAKNKGSLLLNTEFTSENHQYSVIVPDYVDVLYSWADIDNVNDSSSNYLIYARFLKQSATEASTESEQRLVAGNEKGTALSKVLVTGAVGNEVVFRASNTVGDITYYQDYMVAIHRQLSLSNLEVCVEENQMILYQENGSGFDEDIQEYEVLLSKDVQEMELRATACKETLLYGESESHYQIWIDGKQVAVEEAVTIPLDGSGRQILIKVLSSEGQETEYIVNILQKEPIEVTFQLEPADAVLTLTQDLSGERVLPVRENVWSLMQGYQYTYVLTKNGYVAQTGSLLVESEAMEVKLALEKAPENPDIDTSIESDWSNFRGNSDNNAVTNTLIATEPEKAVLYWATGLGDGFDTGAVGSPILADGYVITYSGSKLYKVDPIDGHVVKSADMAGSSSFAITAPLYAEGMIFIGLSNGRVQAFNAATLESLWLYTDALQGQPNCPLVYDNGYLYTGFWNSEIREANYVCLSVTDENTSQKTEAKLATWTYSHKGGFYWAGACVRDGFLLVGTDDGANGYTSATASLLSIHTRTGEIIDALTGIEGDVRSSVVYDKETERYYFASKAGILYQVKVTEDGKIDRSSVKTLSLINETGSAGMCTSSPVVYNGRLYVGVCGEAQFSEYSGHNITVVDIAKWAIAYSVPTQGYPQTSGLLTTAYEEASGYVYIYFFDNYTPGKLRVLKDKKGVKSPLLTQTESYVNSSGKDSSIDTALALFTPSGKQAQYAIGSPISDEYGTIYFKNDSGYLMAVGSTIQKLEITQKPQKTTYQAGEKFDAKGMKVTAIYSNGRKRDVTEYVSYPTSVLTADDSEVKISFNHVLYQNQEGKAGKTVKAPTATLDITVKSGKTSTSLKKQTISSKSSYNKVYGDAAFSLNAKTNGDGKLTYQSSNAKVAAVNSKGKVSIQGVGSAKITITASQTAKYKQAKATVTIQVGLAKPQLTKIENSKNGVSLKWKKAAGAAGYIVYRKSGSGSWKKIKKLTGSSKNSYVDTSAKNGTSYTYTVKAFKGKINSALASSKKMTYLSVSKLTKLDAGSKKMTVQWKKNPKVTGYQIVYAANRKWNKKTTIKIAKKTTTKKTIRKLTTKKTYYVKIRVYKKVGGKTYYSSWSGIKSVKVK